MLFFFRKICLCRPWLLVVMFVMAVLGQAGILPAAGQGPEKKIAEATLQLWPEYDDPGLLVIYSGNFTDTVTFPQEIAVPLPAGARGIQATSKEADGRLITQPWQIVDGKLTYSLPGPGFHIEYYVDRPPSGDQREIGFMFEAPYATDSLDVRVQQPARATGFSLTPPPDSSAVGDDGLTYSTLRKINLKQGDRLDLKIRYTKADQGLTSAPIAAVQTAPTLQSDSTREAAPSASANSWLPWVLIGAGLVALAAAAVYWFLRGRSSPTPGPAARGARPAKSSSPAATSPASATGAFCTQCGRQFQPDERFCANCGAPR